MVKSLPAMQEAWVRSLSQEDLETRTATHSSLLGWRIPWTEEPDETVCGVAGSNTAERLTLWLHLLQTGFCAESCKNRISFFLKDWFPSFLPFPVSRFHPGYHITFINHVSRLLRAVVVFLALPWFGHPWGMLVKYSVESPSGRVCLMFSSLWVLEGKTTEANPVFLTSYWRCILLAWHIVDVNFDHLAEGVFVRILHCKVTLFPLSILCSLEGSHFFMSGVLCSTLWNVEYLHMLFAIFHKGDTAFLSHLLFNHLVTSVWTHG